MVWSGVRDEIATLKQEMAAYDLKDDLAAAAAGNESSKKTIVKPEDVPGYSELFKPASGLGGQRQTDSSGTPEPDNSMYRLPQSFY